LRPRAVQQGVAVSRLSEEARSADDAGAPPARLRAGRSDKATRRPLDRRRALASLRESGRREMKPRVPSCQSNSLIGSAEAGLTPVGPEGEGSRSIGIWPASYGLSLRER